MVANIIKKAKSLQNQIALLISSEKSQIWLEVWLIILVFLLSDFLKNPSVFGLLVALSGVLLMLLSRLSTFNQHYYDGIYKFLRHPRSLGLVCVLAGLLLQTNSQYLFVSTVLLVLVYILWVIPSLDALRNNKVKFDYKVYQHRVSALLPGLPYEYLRSHLELTNSSQFTLQNEAFSYEKPSWRRRIYTVVRQEWLLLLLFLLITLHLYQVFYFLRIGFNISDFQIKLAIALIYVSIFIWSHKNKIVALFNIAQVRKKVNS